MRTRLLLVVPTFAALLVAAPFNIINAQGDSATRVWKDKTGKFRLEATYEGVNADKVKLRRKDDGRIIDVSLLTLSDDDIDFIRARAPLAFGAGDATKILTAAALESAAQRRRYAVDILALHDHFIADAAIPAVEQAQAQKSREKWVIPAAAKKIRMGAKWYTPAEYRDLAKDERAILETAHDFSYVSDWETVTKKLKQVSALNPGSVTADFLLGICDALCMDRKRRSASEAEDHFAACIRRLTAFQQDLTDAERANLAACYNNRALTCMRQRNFSAALRDFEQCLNTAPPADAVLHNLGQFQIFAADSRSTRSRDDLSVIRLTSDEKSRLDRVCGAVRGISSAYTPRRGWRYMWLAEVDLDSLLRDKVAGVIAKPVVPQGDLVEAGGGTGFVIGPGFIATNQHVTDGGIAFTARTDAEEKANAKPATIVAASGDPNLDVAVLKCDGLSAPPLSLNATIPKLATEIHTLGFPKFYQLGTRIKVSKGIITALPPLREIAVPNCENYLMHDATTAPGSSGGPVFDQHGLVVGVHTASVLQTFKLAVPAVDSTKFFAQHVPGLKPKSPPPGELRKWEEVVETVRASTVHILVYRRAARHNAVLQAEPELRWRSYDDSACFACYGTGFLKCQNSQCDLGSVKAIREDVVTLPGGLLGKTRTPIRVDCPACDGGFLRCQYCSDGNDPRFSR